ncbi:MAG: CBS domain-containing protein [Phycisphaerales bacterium]|nr:CBS domain-containing protein [Phycisphaerales bacterium]
MGVQGIEDGQGGSQHRATIGHVLSDLNALEMMLEKGMIETGIRRIGAEQELALVDDACQPAPVGPEILDELNETKATTEIGRYNLELNLSPMELTGGVLCDVHNELDDLMGRTAKAAAKHKARPVLIGMLPTILQEHLSMEFITPRPRYYALNERISKAKGGRFDVQIKGIDELKFTHDNIMVEALNTSFQLHYQVNPEDFAISYNCAQLITAPTLAAAANSAVLFGKRLWHETRIAIFEQIVDTSGAEIPSQRDVLKRVRFGEKWVESSVLEIYRDDVTRFRALFGSEKEEDSIAMVERGEVPKLYGLQTHNSTVYRWNRPCYGITNGKPHLRIENRVLPAGPSIADEVANAALWFGLMIQMPKVYPDLIERMPFEHTRANFVASARYGLNFKMHWMDETTISVRDLLLEELIPLAKAGLKSCSIDQGDIDLYMGIIEARVASGKNGARWMLDSVAKIHDFGTRAERLGALTAATIARQASGMPVHEWALADINECGNWQCHYERVGQYMQTDLFTVQADELIDLAASIMGWEKIRHIPVEDDKHNLVGLLSYRAILKLVADPKMRSKGAVSVADIMERDPVTATPETSTLDAIERMKEHGTSCLPVVEGGKLVGIVTEHDYMRIAGQLLEDQLRANAQRTEDQE